MNEIAKTIVSAVISKLKNIKSRTNRKQFGRSQQQQQEQQKSFYNYYTYAIKAKREENIFFALVFQLVL